jgi:RNA polymerase sigma-70 factor (ECF subfamily)
MPHQLDFERLVEEYYGALYRFALSLTRQENDAWDLTQQTFLIWARKGHQLQDPAKVKTWLFTTLHRQFLQGCRRMERFPHTELPGDDSDAVMLSPEQALRVDEGTLLEAMQRLDPMFRAPLALFYLEDCSYNEIAERLDIPLGTVKSRISRAIQQLQNGLSSETVKSMRNPHKP